MDYAKDKSMHLPSLVGYTTVWSLQNDAGGKKNSTYASSAAKAKSPLYIHGPSRILNGCLIIHYLLGCNQARSHGGALHPLQIWMHLLEVKKNVKDRRADHSAAKRAEPYRLHVLPPLNCRGWKRLFCKNVCMCKMRATFIGSIILLNYWFCCPNKHAFYTYAYTYTQYMYNSIIHVYKCMYINAPLLEAAAPTVFMVWLFAWL